MDKLLIALAALVLTGCAATTAVPKGAAPAPGMATETATYRERIALTTRIAQSSLAACRSRE